MKGAIVHKRSLDTSDDVAGRMHRRESEAATVFEKRWTLRALKRVDPDLHERLDDQGSMFRSALMHGNEDEIVEQGEAMCRGWAAAAQRMEEAKEPDDAYFMGSDPVSGVRVAIGDQVAARERVRDLHGDRVIWMSPDEVAAMFAGLQIVATVKALWPGAEIESVKPKPIERFPDQPAQGDE